MSHSSPTSEAGRRDGGEPARLQVLLDAAVVSSGAIGGAVWRDESDSFALVAQRGLGRERLDQVHHDWPGHHDLLAGALSQGKIATVSATFESERSGVPRELQLVVAPLAETEAGTLLELFLPAGAETHPIGPLVESLSRLARYAEGETQPSSRSETGGEGLVARLHASLDLDETLFAVANELRVALQWDRVSVGLTESGRCRLRVISGLEEFDERAGAARGLSELMQRVNRSAEPLVWSAADERTHSISEDPFVGTYLTDARLQVLVVVSLPLDGHGAEGAALVLCFEQMSPPGTDWPGIAAVEKAAPLAARATAQAVLYERSRRGWRGRALVWLSRRRTWVRLALVAAVLLGVMALCVVPAELTVSAPGTVEPRTRRDIFPPEPGIVERVAVQHGADVTAGEVLLTLRSPELELEISKVQGEVHTVDQQILDLETLRSDPTRAGLGAATGAAELAAREEELKTVRQGLAAQLALLEERRRALTLRSPIDGQVVTWEAETLLDARPVDRVSRLLTVASFHEEWHLELWVDARDVGLLEAARAEGESKVTFVFPSAPRKTWEGTVEEVARSVTVHPQHGPAVRVRVTIPQEACVGARPGTVVIPRVHCGTGAVGYVWFRRVIDRVRTWWALL